MTDEYHTSEHEDLLLDWEGACRRLRFLQETNHVLLQDLAADLGVKKSYLQEVLDGRTRPSNRILNEAARYFRVTVEFLTSGKPGSTREAVRELEEREHRGARGNAQPPRNPRPDRHGKTKPGMSRGPARRKRGLGLQDLAIRHQALVEALVRRGVISAAEYNDCLALVKSRALRC